MKFYQFQLIIVMLRIVNSSDPVSIVKIGGNLTLSDCISGKMPSKSEMDITTTELIKQAGYPVEEHIIVTEDGYLLTIHRIPGPAGAQPVLLKHGILGSSFDWVALGKGRSLVYLLADRGYDVWIGNSRGCTYSRCHISYTTSDPRFWDFSYHEMGIYDLPAEITYIVSKTNKRLIYIGHSMGTTMFHVMTSERPDIAVNVKAMFSFAPIVYLDNARSFLLQFAPFTRELEDFIKVMGTAEILSQSYASKLLMKYLCTITQGQRKLCVSLISSIFGFDLVQFDYSLTPLILYHTPAGTSLKVVIHYCQERNSGKFQQYDYGKEKNMQIYKNIEPPYYNLTKSSVPTGLFYGRNDFFSDPKDVRKLRQQLPNIFMDYPIKYRLFNHIDFLLGKNAPRDLYGLVINVMEKYRIIH